MWRGDEVVAGSGATASGLPRPPRPRRRYGIAVETADALNIVMNVCYTDTPRTINRLVTALADIAGRGPLARDTRHGSGRHLPPFSRLVMTPREAFFADSRALPVRRCIGQVSAEMVTPYPPGVPVIGPGEEVTDELVVYLMEARERGLAIHGPQDTTLATLRVVAGGAAVRA